MVSIVTVHIYIEVSIVAQLAITLSGKFLPSSYNLAFGKSVCFYQLVICGIVYSATRFLLGSAYIQSAVKTPPHALSATHHVDDSLLSWVSQKILHMANYPRFSCALAILLSYRHFTNTQYTEYSLQYSTVAAEVISCSGFHYPVYNMESILAQYF